MATTVEHRKREFRKPRFCAHHIRERERELARRGLVPIRDLIPPAMKALLRKVPR